MERKIGRLVLVLAEMAEAALRAFVEQGSGPVSIWVAVPATKMLAVLIRSLRGGQ